MFSAPLDMSRGASSGRYRTDLGTTVFISREGQPIPSLATCEAGESYETGSARWLPPVIHGNDMAPIDIPPVVHVQRVAGHVAQAFTIPPGQLRTLHMEASDEIRPDSLQVAMRRCGPTATHGDDSCQARSAVVRCRMAR